MSVHDLLATSRGRRALAFNLQPSRILHPARWLHFARAGIPLPEPGDAAGHRHASRLILHRLGLQDALADDLACLEWAVALAPPETFARARRHLGLVRTQDALRHIVRRHHVQLVAARLAPQELDFVHRIAPALGEPDPAFAARSLEELLNELDDIGTAVLAQATEGATAPLRDRARLRHPPEMAHCAMAPPDALALALRVLEELEPTCHSSFPTRV